MAPVRIKMHGAGTTGTRRTTGLPCAMGYGLLRALPGDRALLPPSPQGARCALQELGISVGMPGPHGLAVRIDVVRPPANSALQLRLRPPHPAFNARDDRETPLLIEHGTRAGDTDFGKNESGIFFGGGLDRGDGVEEVRETSFLAQVVFGAWRGAVVRSGDQNWNRFARRAGRLTTPSWPGVVPAIHGFRRTR